MRAFAKIFVPLLAFLPALALAQIDPIKRDLIQFGYNQSLEGQPPISGYAFYYHNDPDFLRTNITLRLAVAPVYLDSELGFVHGLGPQTDFAIGVAGGGFADSYNEIRGGKYIKEESFDGNGGELSSSIYHLFNPDDLIPLNYVLRGAVHYAAYEPNDTTAPDFRVPTDNVDFTVRTGLRFGGIEPTLYPDLAMELAIWYQGQFRLGDDVYGYHGDRQLQSASHLFWGSAALSYTFPDSKQNFFVRLIAGTSLETDRLNAYRLGGFLPLVAEYPLSLPGFYYQELTARRFVLLNASYTLPVTRDQRWNLIFNGATAGVDYLRGTGQSGNWVNGIGAGLMYRSASDKFKVIISYAYGIDAVRTHGRGANSVGILLQIDLEKTGTGFSPTQLGHWSGWQHLFGR